MHRFLPTIILLLFSGLLMSQEQTSKDTRSADREALRVGVIGLVHTHVHWLLGREDLHNISLTL